MNISLQPDPSIFERYHSRSQQARVITEHWASQNLYCPHCARPKIFHEANNAKARDFSCPNCGEIYEMKSKKSAFGNTINDGAFETMKTRAGDSDSPSFFLLRYSSLDWRAVSLEAIPRMFILPDMVIARKPLSATAVRGPWVGCNIDIRRVPESGRIRLITDGKPASPKAVMNSWHRITFLDERQSLPQRGWTIDVMSEVDALQRSEFSLDDLYIAATDRLKALHQDNHHIHDKIRQQLQVLRDAGYLRFLGRGKYGLV